ncbi:MAG: superoxide dismutase [Cu-Zn] SodC [Alphaproteobacteria bacterium]
MKKLLLSAVTVVVCSTVAWAATQTVKMSAISEIGPTDPVGTVTFEDSKKGLVVKTNLWGLPPGPHGFHVHQNPSCDGAMQEAIAVPGGAAGGHYDPKATGKHMGPDSKEGHAGDLPLITVDDSGKSKQTLVAPNLKLAEIKNRAVIIHQGGDNYSDQPQPLGGGGRRIACGIIN